MTDYRIQFTNGFTFILSEAVQEVSGLTKSSVQVALKRFRDGGNLVEALSCKNHRVFFKNGQIRNLCLSPEAINAYKRLGVKIVAQLQEQIFIERVPVQAPRTETDQGFAREPFIGEGVRTQPPEQE